MATLSRLTRFIVRMLVFWFVSTLALLFTAWLLPGITITSPESSTIFVVATTTALLLSVVNFLIRPLLLLLTLPLGWMATFLAGFFINAFILLITDRLVANFQVDSFLSALFGSFILSLISTILITLLDIDDDDTFYDNLVQRHAARQAKPVSPGEGRGLVMLEVDGLSYQRMKKAIEDRADA